LPAMQEWSAAARAEHDFLVEDEPYRSAPGGAARNAVVD
jgi:glutathione S-transferase